MKTFDAVLKACWDAAWSAAHASDPTPAGRYVRDQAFADWRARLSEPFDDSDTA